VPYAKFGDPQTLNLYTYVENGPINRADADGHQGAQYLGGWCDSNGCISTQQQAAMTQSANKALNTVTFSSTQQTTTKNADGTTTTVTTTTLITFASGTNDAGTFRGADRVVNTRVTTADGSPANVAGGNDNTSVTHISQKDAIGAVGSRAFTDAQQSAKPSFGSLFGTALHNDVVNHPFRTIGRAIAIGALTADPPTSLLGAGLAATGAAADLGESVQHATEEQ
jgi:hypothetical protein